MVVVLALLTASAACSTGTNVVIETPPLQELEARQVPFRFRGEWGVIVRANVDPAAPALTPYTRVPLLVTTDAGDVEELLLRPRVCESDEGPYLCVQFLFSMEEGRHVGEVMDRVDDINGELRYVADPDGWFGNGLIYDGDVNRVIRIVRTWPGVRSANRDILFYPLAGSAVHARQLAVYARLELGEAVAGDGRIQARAGDSVTVSYEPPTGSRVASGFVMCEVLTTGDILEGGLGEIPPCA
jgi:hypothetical protein